MRTLLGACVGLGIGALLAISITADDISARARKLHFSSIVVDTHDDTTQRLLGRTFDLAQRDSKGSVDIPRMKDGGLGAIFFSIWVPGSVTGPEAVKQALAQMDAVREQVRRNPRDLALATTADEVRRARQDGKIAALIGIEGGHMIASDLAVLQKYAALGARYLTLTHSKNDEWADASTDKPAHNGLTNFGKDVVRKLNRLGVMVDISHVSDKTFYDALDVSKAPLIASHSSCRAICNAPRNMSDDMIRALAVKGGVIQINYHVGFLSQEFYDAVKAHPEYDREMQAEAKRLCGEDFGCQTLEGDRLTRELVKEGKLPRVGYEKILDHIDHAVQVAGVEHVGLGSDFDGANMPYGMEDVSMLPKITEGLLRRGYSGGDVRKILGENTLRLMGEVERVAKELQQK